MMKYNWAQADLLITNSRWTAGQVLSRNPEFRERMITSYEGLQHEIFQPVPDKDESAMLREKFNLEPGYFLWISNFYPYKQAGLLIAGYARLKPETRRRHPLVMVGGNWLNGNEEGPRLYPQRLKPNIITSTYGRPEGRPLQRTWFFRSL